MMNSKKFLKPTISKIIAAIFILIIFVPFINYDTGIRCIAAPCPASANGSIVIWLIFSYNFQIYSISYAALIIGIILSYLLSCIIIFAINKTRKR